MPALFSVRSCALTSLHEELEETGSCVRPRIVPTIEEAAAAAERQRIAEAIRKLAADYGVRGWEESELTLLHLAEELKADG